MTSIVWKWIVLHGTLRYAQALVFHHSDQHCWPKRKAYKHRGSQCLYVLLDAGLYRIAYMCMWNHKPHRRMIWCVYDCPSHCSIIISTHASMMYMHECALQTYCGWVCPSFHFDRGQWQIIVFQETLERGLLRKKPSVRQIWNVKFVKGKPHTQANKSTMISTNVSSTSTESQKPVFLRLI